MSVLDVERPEVQEQIRWPLHHALVGSSAAITEVRDLIDRVAPSDLAVLITGETGTGKDLVARELHAKSLRHEKPFIKVNCPAIPENLIESELFGYERGGFTGAQRSRPGQFELAHQGTFFLDEISEISLHAQTKIIQALDGEPFIRIGGVTPVQFDVRVIAATSLPLDVAVARGKIREEVVFRLSEVVVQLPPLRAHREDIPLLAEHFAYNFCRQSDIRYEPLPDHVVEMLQQRDWPGNTRELAARVREYLTPGGTQEHLKRSSPQSASASLTSPDSRRRRHWVIDSFSVSE